MGPGLDGEIWLGVETYSQDDDREEAGDVARQLPIFPFAGLAGRQRCSIEEVAIRPLLVPRRRPSAWTGVAGGSPGEETVAQHAGQGHDGALFGGFGW